MEGRSARRRGPRGGNDHDSVVRFSARSPKDFRPVQVVAIASRTRSLAEKVAADFNIPVVYDSLAEMLADAELDAVINATPGPAHYATSMEILSAGKHLITDKPLASTVAEADQRSAPWPQRTTS